jgi:uncharacterized surface protein with fasciclin (FAS1) repeats
MKNLIKKMAIATIALTMFSCSDDDNNSNQPQTIADIAIAGADFSTLERALVRTNLVGTLDGTGSFTVFAPTNAAFETFFDLLGPTVTVENVDVNVLKAILLNHVIADEITFAEVPTAGYAATLSTLNSAANGPGISMFLQKSGTTITINGNPYSFTVYSNVSGVETYNNTTTNIKTCKIATIETVTNQPAEQQLDPTAGKIYYDNN